MAKVVMKICDQVIFVRKVPINETKQAFPFETSKFYENMRAWTDSLKGGFEGVLNVSQLQTVLSYAQLTSLRFIGWERAQQFIAGFSMLDAISRSWPAGNLRITECGFHEGVLIAQTLANGIPTLGLPTSVNLFACFKKQRNFFL